MKNLVLALILFFLAFSINEIKSQTVIGKLVDENGVGLAGIQLQLYVMPNVYNSTSGTDGSFTFNNVITVQDELLPVGYSVSNNYPNPFNPVTRFVMTIPVSGIVKVEVFNLLGQTVADVIEKTFNAGTNYIDIELNGLPNGFYISRITIDDKYTVVKKMMLIYGSQHLTTSVGPISTPLNKSNNTYLETNIDSLVATSSIIGRKTFTNLPSIISDTLDLGNLTIERFCPDCPTVLYEGKTYHTVQIGNQCWLKENLDVGTMIQGIENQTSNGVIEKYCYNDDPNNCITYGGLYQWNEAMQYVTNEGAQGICPPGWHLPTDDEWAILGDLLGGSNIAGSKMKSTGTIEAGTGLWHAPNSGATNVSGFTGLPGGLRNLAGIFGNLGNNALFWSSTGTYDTAWCRMLSYNVPSLGRAGNYKIYGFSVRCVKD
jgi:uncharacterized protein (TIGR02145 family)